MIRILAVRVRWIFLHIWDWGTEPFFDRKSGEAEHRLAQAVSLSLETLVDESPKAVAEGLPAPETDADAQFFRDYLGLSKEDRGRFRQVCELAFGAASSEKPMQEASDIRRRNRMVAAR